MSFYRVYEIDNLYVGQLNIQQSITSTYPSAGTVLYTDGSGGTFWSTAGAGGGGGGGPGGTYNFYSSITNLSTSGTTNIYGIPSNATTNGVTNIYGSPSSVTTNGTTNIYNVAPPLLSLIHI